MTEPDNSAHARFWSQYEVVKAAALDQGIELDHRMSDGGRARIGIPDEIFEKDSLLVPAKDVELVNANMATVEVPNRGIRYRRAGNEPNDLRLLRYDGGRPVPETIDWLAERGVARGTATPNHLVSICGVCLCPASEPVPPAGAAPLPLHAAGNAGDGVRVAVVDTGLWNGYEVDHPWLQDLDGDTLPDITGQSRVPLGAGSNPPIPEYYGHGAFIAGVLRSVAPGVHVHVANSLQWAGAVMEDEFGQHLLDALGVGDRQPHIISLSAGSRTLSRLPHRGIGPFLDELNQPGCTTLLVAAAGNDGETREFYPAALAPEMPESVLSVGALRGDGLGRACFSNYGEWVQVYAPGERHVNAFPTGTYTYVDPQPAPLADSSELGCWYYEPTLYGGCVCATSRPQGSAVPFGGMAEWSGTSFSTPYVAGLIAKHMSETGETNARLAKDAVLATATTITDAGDGVTKLRKLG